ncbi:hypothetical protein [Marinobacter sp.]|uniref:hypothetical protein n=1 Tax=Marinobacter sp. TaxID=50741 RepID=UPI0039A461F3
MKKILATYSPPKGYWVGNGFPVSTLFSYDLLGAKTVSPFLLLDYAGPMTFPPSRGPRGVGQQLPHQTANPVETVADYHGGYLAPDDAGPLATRPGL